MSLISAMAGRETGHSAQGETTAQQNMLQLVQLRWIAVFGQITTIAFVTGVLKIPLPLVDMALVIGGLVALNLFSLFRPRLGRPIRKRSL